MTPSQKKIAEKVSREIVLSKMGLAIGVYGSLEEIMITDSDIMDVRDYEILAGKR
jgi:hypothetical protein